MKFFIGVECFRKSLTFKARVGLSINRFGFGFNPWKNQHGFGLITVATLFNIFFEFDVKFDFEP